MTGFAVTAAVLVLLLFGAALGVAVAQERLVERVQASAPTIKRWGGLVLLAVGAWFIALGIFATTFAGLFPV